MWQIADLKIHVRKRQSLEILTKPQFWMKTLPNVVLCVGKTETVGVPSILEKEAVKFKMSEHMKVKKKKLKKS